MLILTRRPTESVIFIKDNEPIITVRILGVKGSQVRIGTDAPQEWEIHRDEIWERIQMERMQKEG